MFRAQHSCLDELAPHREEKGDLCDCLLALRGTARAARRVKFLADGRRRKLACADDRDVNAAIY